MNKYLLLRDNKQSGPFTVPEIIEKGIKPYDLVWLDGKSISWRYPSEIEELKAYAPAVEEQPFDRFYKKPEQVIKSAPVAEEHSPYVPKMIIENVAEEQPAQKKVYINFPAGNTHEKKVVPEKKIIVPQPKPEPVTFADNTNYIQPERFSSYSSKPASNKKPVYYASAACLVLVALVTILFINNNNQQERLKELNTIVKDIENKKANEFAAQVKNTETVPAPAQPQSSETIINPELLSNNDYSKPESLKTLTAAEESATLPKQSAKATEIAPGIVYKERPVLRRSENQQTTPAVNNESAEPVASSENIYKLVSVKPNNYKTGVLGGISNLQFELTNNSNRELHKVAIEIKYLGPEKKVVNRQIIYFENISPGGHSTIDVPKSKRGVTIDYTITDIKS